MVFVFYFPSIKMKSNLIKRITLIASIVLTLSIFGATIPLEMSVASEPSREQITMLVAGASEEVGANNSKQDDTAAISNSELPVNSDNQEGAADNNTSEELDPSFGQNLERWAECLLSWEMWQLIWGGLKTTVIIFVFAAIVSILLGILLTYLDISHKCSWFFEPFSWFVRNIHDVPSVALMMFFYYVVFAGKMNGILVSIIALGVYMSGSMLRIFSIHIQQVGEGQIEAGRALGMTTRQCYRYIVLPQAVKSMIPFIIPELKVLLRATSYAGYVSQKDLIKAVFTIRDIYSDMLVPLLIASILYLLISRVITKQVEYWSVKIFKYD